MLPSGFYDQLCAKTQHAAIHAVLSKMQQYGYTLTEPAMVEFSDQLAPAHGENHSYNTFRFIDPYSGELLALRADITPQLSRIASTQLAHQTRPLRLCYAGHVMRLKQSPLQPARQLMQIGCERFGSHDLIALKELFVVLSSMLQVLNIQPRITIELTAAGLVPELIQNDTIRAQLYQKHPIQNPNEAVKAFLRNDIETLHSLSTNDDTISALEVLPELESWAQNRLPNITWRRDMVASNRFQYHSGICFSVYVEGINGVVAQGGCYRTEVEPAAGFSLYLNSLLELLQNNNPSKRLLTPIDLAPEILQKLHFDDWQTIFSEEISTQNAKQYKCHALYKNDSITKV